MIVSGLLTTYRPAAAIGLLAAATGATVMVEFESVAELNIFIGSITVLFVPVFIISWIALSSEEEDAPFEFKPERKAVLSTAIYASLCLASAPAVVFILGIFSPSISIRMSLMSEIAIMLVAAIAGAIILTYKRKRPSVQGGA